VTVTPEERAHLERLRALVARAGGRRVRRLTGEELVELPRLYRFASSLLARLETRGGAQDLVEELRPTLLGAHGLLYRHADGGGGSLPARVGRYFLSTVPAAVRREWRLVLATAGVLYALATIAFLLVRADLGLAYSLLAPEMVDTEIAQLRGLEAGEPFRGNFTFGRGASAGASGWIMGNNMRVAVTFFALALVPPLYVWVLAANSLMLGTYTAVASHWGQAGAISSILWCHGVLEIQAIVLAGTAGLVLLRSWVAPGPWSRREAIRRNAGRAVAILMATFPMLFAAALIEGFVSPHASTTTRIAVALASGVALVAWLTLPDRSRARNDG